MNIEMIVNVTAYAVVILGGLMVIALAAGTTALVCYWALEHIVGCTWGVRNVCEYLIDKRKREREEKRNSNKGSV